MAAIMFQGTGSNVGKSMLVAGLCRAARQRGISVAPFKPQNMSNNAAVTPDGGEIGRAQALQAQACGLDASVHMNPVLLKPQSNVGSQVVVQGKVIGQMKARSYTEKKPQLLDAVMQSYAWVKDKVDLVIVEGAGSASEVNLRAGDIANMGFAQAAQLPVILIGDIDRGGVIASLVGTYHLLPKSDRDLIKGYVINKFRGDVTLFDEGLKIITNETKWQSFGVLPWFDQAGFLPAEDSEDLKREMTIGKDGTKLKIAVPILPRIANFDDLDAMKSDPDISIEMIEFGVPIPADVDLVMLPGSKSTIADLKALRNAGWDIDIKAHIRRGGRVLGLCGGYQMLGKAISDPEGIEGPAGECVDGLGLLDLDTHMQGEKRTKVVSATYLKSGEAVSGYEIHIGVSQGKDRQRPLFDIKGEREGAMSANGRVAGTYIHGLFNSDNFRRAFLRDFLSHSSGDGAKGYSYHALVEQTLDQLADHVEHHLDVDALLKIAKSA